MKINGFLSFKSSCKIVKRHLSHTRVHYFASPNIILETKKIFILSTFMLSKYNQLVFIVILKNLIFNLRRKVTEL